MTKTSVLLVFVTLLLCCSLVEGKSVREVPSGEGGRAGRGGLSEVDYCGVSGGHNDTCCNDYNTVPNFFWDWLLFPLAVEDVEEQLGKLLERLGAINNKVGETQYEQLESSLDFGEVLRANAEWLHADLPYGGVLRPFNAELDEMIEQLIAAIATQSQSPSPIKLPL